MKSLVGFLLLLVVTQVQAESFDDQWDKVCTKIQQCTMEQIKQLPDSFPESVRKQMQAGLDQACDKAKEEFQGDLNNASAAETKAVIACAKSLQGLSCDQLMQSNNATKECQALEAMAE